MSVYWASVGFRKEEEIIVADLYPRKVELTPQNLCWTRKCVPRSRAEIAVMGSCYHLLIPLDQIASYLVPVLTSK